MPRSLPLALRPQNDLALIVGRAFTACRDRFQAVHRTQSMLKTNA